jgi:hypothetical protein
MRYARDIYDPIHWVRQVLRFFGLVPYSDWLEMAETAVANLNSLYEWKDKYKEITSANPESGEPAS